MSNNVFFLENQIPFVLYSFVIGLLCGVFFDILAVKREVFWNNRAIIFADDFFTGLLFFLILFCFSLEYNHGIIRWYNISMLLLGVTCYRKTIHKTVYCVLLRTVTFLLLPVKFLIRFLLIVQMRLSVALASVRRSLYYRQEKKRFLRLAARGFNLT